MRLMLAGFIAASVSYNQNRRRRMDLDIYVRVLAISIVLGNQDSRRVEFLRRERAA
jgi:hypothetical protein